MKNILPLSMILLIGFTSCDKPGPGGQATIEGLVMHHSRVIPNDTVYIKYNAIQEPGTSPSNYDNHVYADSSGHYKFTGMEDGNYYLYGIGFDDSIYQKVIGGIPITVNSESQDLVVNVPVTEN